MIISSGTHALVSIFESHCDGKITEHSVFTACFNHLQVNFLSPAKLGETVMVEGHLLKMGRSLAFTQVNLLHEDGSMIATGRHTKAFPFVKAAI